MFESRRRIKDSGINGLGELPEDWEVIPLRRVLSRIEQGWSPVAVDAQASDEEWGVLKLSAISQGDFYESEHKALPEGIAPVPRFEVRPGDLLLTRANTPQLVGDVCLVRESRRQLMISDLVYRLSVVKDRVHKGFLCYWLLSCFGRRQIIADARGSSLSMVKVSQEHIRSWLVALPTSIEEQCAIAEYLDRKTAITAATIRKKERLVSLLQEKRQAVIHNAVTRGLDPMLPMKDSGIEWLGSIPVHWDVRRLKFLVCETLAGPFGSSLMKEMYVTAGYRVYGQEQVISNDFSIGDYYIPEDKYREMIRYAVDPGDILVSCVGSFGKVAIVPEDAEPGIINPRLVKLVANTSVILPAYLAVLLRSTTAFAQMEAASHGGTMGVVNLSLLSQLQLPVPPLEEQEKLLALISDTTSTLDKAVRTLMQQIGLLREHRDTLIAHTVTGKINVRQEALACP
jgi:type I restriction enzyme, S subunit